MKNTEPILIRTVHPTKRAGILMTKALYDDIVAIIVRTIKSGENPDLNTLLTKSAEALPKIPNISWYVYQVKLDLEARGYIKSFCPTALKSLVLKLTQTGIKTLSK